MPLLYLLSYVASLAAFLFVTLSLASGLLWLSELIEEHTKIAKVVGKKCIYAIIVLHILLAFTDALPAHKIMFSILCHVIYLQNFSDVWPLVSLSSQSFIASCVLVIADHFLWFFHFSRLTHQAHHTHHTAYRGGPVVRPPAFGEMATFFAICVWLTPLFLFLSLSANDNTLPTSGPLDVASNSPSVSSFPHPPPRQRPRASLIRLMLGFVPGLSQSSSRGAEGLIAPPSPGIPPFSPHSPSHARPRTPLTPTRSASYGEVGDSTTIGIRPEFALGLPPPRRPSSSHAAGTSPLGHPLARRRGSDMDM